jgi:hypothetical protein
MLLDALLIVFSPTSTDSSDGLQWGRSVDVAMTHSQLQA